ncbi:cytidine deaminase [Tepidanaerobacter syntrophicus]|uniref:Cytidine deaminase n=1 Tax=Tepidanaerobacter syntrophicus TaxID=224999 RepID=A0A0U9HE87_9FIRM|nr:cytidine deaminase [Tepidanaerobacter syntrophicus]GAQ25138.1 cytidine deaminase [Tepidanaerobacter syntrophicus]GLI50693.1 cytidine deaminase [Tepidanaerobacter syntrophicus]HHV83484.1 cytidine deaminase [Tepidanaerobacter syntrophicus]
MIEINKKELVKKALSAMENAYVPYSKFPVGACAATADGETILGCNIENASYGLTVCAERVTLFKAYSEGKKDIAALAVAANVDEPVSPCGACRQVIAELAPSAIIYLSNRDGSKIKTMTVEELLPYAFRL